MPMTMSTLPSSMPAAPALCSLAERKRDSSAILHRPVGEAVGESLEVLLGEQRGGHQHRDLLAVHHRDEGGAQRDLGLAEADIAADQPVHRLAGLQVVDHRLDRGGLVGRFLETETGGEGLVVVRAELEGMALARGALRVQIQQFGGGVAHLLLRACAWPCPTGSLPSLCSGAVSGAPPL